MLAPCKARPNTTLDPWTTRTVGIATSKIWCTWMVTPIHTIGVHLRKYAWNPPWGRPCTMGPCPVCWHHFRKVNLDTKPWMERYCVPAADQPFEIWRRWTTSGADNDGPPRWGWLIGTAELKSILKWVASRDNGNLASQKLRINLRKCFFFGRLGRLGHVGTREGSANRLIRGGASHGLGYASSYIYNMDPAKY